MQQAKEKLEKPDWVKITPQEVEKLVLELHKAGNSTAKIGLILRDKHSIPKAKLLGKRITQILKENKLPFKTEKDIFKDKIKSIEKHISQHKHDYTAKRSLTKTLWSVKKLEKVQQ